MFSDRISRLIKLMMLLQTSTGWDSKSLAQQLEISTRTLFRDLKTLEEAGIPCRGEKGGDYRVQDGFYMPPVSLTASEVLGLMQLTRFVGQHRERPFHTQALSAIYKLISTVPEAMRVTCGQMLSNISIEPDPTLSTKAESLHFTQLQKAVDLRRACRVTYGAVHQEGKQSFEIEPYLLHHVNRAWYVLGKTSLHEEVRMLKLIRIQELTLLDRRFGRPASFKISDKLGKAWRLMPEGKVYNIELAFSAKVGINVSEVRWHASQTHKLLEDGRCIMTFKVDGLNEIAWWICGYADQVVVKKPQKLREIVALMHKNAASFYENDIAANAAGN